MIEEKRELLQQVEAQLLSGEQVDRAVIGRIFPVEPELTEPLFACSGAVRERYFGNRVQTCAILNTKCGSCSEDCTYCAQSVHYNTGIESYPLLPDEELMTAARDAAAGGARRFSFVTSGRGLDREDVARLSVVLCRLRRELPQMEFCLSLGILEPELLQQLREAGATQYHHNLEASSGYYSTICTTHSWQDRVDTVRAAAAAGFAVCSGALLGLGESWQDRIDLAFEVRSLGVSSIPINFLSPIPNTPSAVQGRMDPDEALQSIALFRLVNPQAHIRLCGGRAETLGDRQQLMFAAGADGIMIGNYLVTAGSPYAEDMQLIRDCGMDAAPFQGEAQA